MKRSIALTLAVLLLYGLCACAAKQPSADLPSEKESLSAPLESRSETQKNPEPPEKQAEPQTDSEASENRTEAQTDPEASEIQTEAQTRDEPETKTVSLTLPFMKTEDFVSFWSEGNTQAAGLTLQVPADWTEDAGLFYCPMDGSVRKVLEPVCLVEAMDDAQWEKLAHFDITQPDGETTYLSVTGGVDANGRDYIQLLGESYPEGGMVSVWYPCFCYLRDAGGSTVVLTYYLLDPEDQTAKAELREILDSIRLE